MAWCLFYNTHKKKRILKSVCLQTHTGLTCERFRSDRTLHLTIKKNIDSILLTWCLFYNIHKKRSHYYPLSRADIPNSNLRLGIQDQGNICNFLLSLLISISFTTTLSFHHYFGDTLASPTHILTSSPYKATTISVTLTFIWTSQTNHNIMSTMNKYNVIADVIKPITRKCHDCDCHFDDLISNLLCTAQWKLHH